MATLLITGAGGRIGTILRKHWKDSHHLIGVDRNPYIPAKRDKSFYTSVERLEPLMQAFAAAGPGTIVVHLAAETWDTAGWEAIERVNIRGTANVFRLAQGHRARKVIFASSNHVTGAYDELVPPDGDQPYSPPPETITPQMLPKPDSLYGVSKAFGELLGFYFSRKYNLPTVCLRIGSVTDTDDPMETPRPRYTWLSHRDLRQLFDCSLTAKTAFGIYYGVSNNTQRCWDITNAERELGYHPQDNAEERHTMKGAGP